MAAVALALSLGATVDTAAVVKPRYVTPVGPDTVSLCTAAATPLSIASDTCKVLVTAQEQHFGVKHFGEFAKAAKKHVAAWLDKQGVLTKCRSIGTPFLRGEDGTRSVNVVAILKGDAETPVLTASGIDGIFTYPVFEGEWDNGTKSGSGAYFWTNGDRYEGQFVDGIYHGEGTFTYASGRTVTGDWDSGKPWDAVARDASGKVTHGFSEGVPQCRKADG